MAMGHAVRLAYANIVAIDFRMPNTRNPERTRSSECGKIAFTYQKII